MLAAGSSHAQGRAECSVIKSTILARPVRYCAFLPASFDQDKTRRYPVLYYLHGLGDNEQSLLNLGGWDVIDELRRQGKIGDFIVLAPSAGHTFYLNSAERQDSLRRLPHQGVHAADGEEVSRAKARVRRAASPVSRWAATERCAWPSSIRSSSPP